MPQAQQSTSPELLTADEIDQIAWKQTLFSCGAVVFDYRLFARDIEKALIDLWGIEQPRPPQ
jgi:hypothetical protein